MRKEQVELRNIEQKTPIMYLGINLFKKMTRTIMRNSLLEDLREDRNKCKKYTMFTDMKTQHSKDGSSLQINL